MMNKPGDLDIDLSPEGRSRAELRAHQVRINGEEKQQLGALANLKNALGDRIGNELIEQVFIHLAESLHDEAAQLRSIKALVEARACFRLLVRKGYPHGSHLQVITDGIDQVRRLLLREVIKRLLRGAVSEAEADRAIALLNDEAAAGQPVESMIDEVEGELTETPKQCA